MPAKLPVAVGNVFSSVINWAGQIIDRTQKSMENIKRIFFVKIVFEIAIGSAGYYFLKGIYGEY